MSSSVASMLDGHGLCESHNAQVTLYLCAIDHVTLQPVKLMLKLQYTCNGLRDF